MQFDIDGMAPADRYELLLGTIVPRPIALITLALLRLAGPGPSSRPPLQSMDGKHVFRSWP